MEHKITATANKNTALKQSQLQQNHSYNKITATTNKNTKSKIGNTFNTNLEIDKGINKTGNHNIRNRKTNPEIRKQFSNRDNSERDTENERERKGERITGTELAT